MQPLPPDSPALPPGAPLCWLHVGDLHLTEAGAENHAALLRIVAEANRALAGRTDFAVLPGDLAENGTAAQYALVRAAVDRLRIPLHAIPGDHDFQPRSLAAYHAGMGGPALPQALHIRGHCCLFLDMVSAGGGGPDFRLGAAQRDWLARELRAARHAGEDCVVFMHTYPADLADPAEAGAVQRLFAECGVACVDMGHTHYNELANDGRTIFAATRSTGQVEEGPVGFALAAVDRGGVAWRFKELDAPWPLVLATAPADRRLLTSADARARTEVRALAWSPEPILRCAYRIDDGDWQDMIRSGDGPLWTASAASPGSASLEVRATDCSGASDAHRIALPGPGFAPPARAADGSDADRIEAWPEIGILGTQLGPNRNGRKW